MTPRSHSHSYCSAISLVSRFSSIVALLPPQSPHPSPGVQPARSEPRPWRRAGR
jgi:hypothetical protein